MEGSALSFLKQNERFKYMYNLGHIFIYNKLINIILNHAIFIQCDYNSISIIGDTLA